MFLVCAWMLVYNTSVGFQNQKINSVTALHALPPNIRHTMHACILCIGALTCHAHVSIVMSVQHNIKVNILFFFWGAILDVIIYFLTV